MPANPPVDKPPGAGRAPERDFRDAAAVRAHHLGEEVHAPYDARIVACIAQEHEARERGRSVRRWRIKGLHLIMIQLWKKICKRKHLLGLMCVYLRRVREESVCTRRIKQRQSAGECFCK